MASRRTKKQKLQAQHQFSVDWEKLAISSHTAQSGTLVKGEIVSSLKASSDKKQDHKKAGVSGVSSSSSVLRQQVIRSLSLAGLILSLELVIYWFTK